MSSAIEEKVILHNTFFSHHGCDAKQLFILKGSHTNYMQDLHKLLLKNHLLSKLFIQKMAGKELRSGVYENI
jgi:hypothetical protein